MKAFVRKSRTATRSLQVSPLGYLVGLLPLRAACSVLSIAGVAAAVFAMAGMAAKGPTPSSSPVQFKDITTQAGIHFKHNAGKEGKKYLPETMGAGVALFDYNNDGKLDILFVNSKD